MPLGQEKRRDDEEMDVLVKRCNLDERLRLAKPLPLDSLSRKRRT